MPEILTPAAQRELRKALTACGTCRIKLDALQGAGLDVSADQERLDRTQQVADNLLKVHDEYKGT